MKNGKHSSVAETGSLLVSQIHYIARRGISVPQQSAEVRKREEIDRRRRMALIGYALLVILAFNAHRGWAQSFPDDPVTTMLPPPQQLDHVQVMAPGGGLLGFQHGMAGNYVPLATRTHSWCSS